MLILNVHIGYARITISVDMSETLTVFRESVLKHRESSVYSADELPDSSYFRRSSGSCNKCVELEEYKTTSPSDSSPSSDYNFQLCDGCGALEPFFCGRKTTEFQLSTPEKSDHSYLTVRARNLGTTSPCLPSLPSSSSSSPLSTFSIARCGKRRRRHRPSSPSTESSCSFTSSSSSSSSLPSTITLSSSSPVHSTCDDDTRTGEIVSPLRSISPFQDEESLNCQAYSPQIFGDDDNYYGGIIAIPSARLSPPSFDSSQSTSSVSPSTSQCSSSLGQTVEDSDSEFDAFTAYNRDEELDSAEELPDIDFIFIPPVTPTVSTPSHASSPSSSSNTQQKSSQPLQTPLKSKLKVSYTSSSKNLASPESHKSVPSTQTPPSPCKAGSKRRKSHERLSKHRRKFRKDVPPSPQIAIHSEGRILPQESKVKRRADAPKVSPFPPRCFDEALDYSNYLNGVSPLTSEDLCPEGGTNVDGQIRGWKERIFSWSTPECSSSSDTIIEDLSDSRFLKRHARFEREEKRVNRLFKKQEKERLAVELAKQREAERERQKLEKKKQRKRHPPPSQPTKPKKKPKGRQSEGTARTREDCDTDFKKRKSNDIPPSPAVGFDLEICVTDQFIS